MMSAAVTRERGRAPHQVARRIKRMGVGRRTAAALHHHSSRTFDPELLYAGARFHGLGPTDRHRIKSNAVSAVSKIGDASRRATTNRL